MFSIDENRPIHSLSQEIVSFRSEPAQCLGLCGYQRSLAFHMSDWNPDWICLGHLEIDAPARRWEEQVTVVTSASLGPFCNDDIVRDIKWTDDPQNLCRIRRVSDYKVLCKQEIGVMLLNLHSRVKKAGTRHLVQLSTELLIG